MWIVRLALRRPYTFVVIALLLLIIGPLVIIRTPVDIFPNIDIPVISIVWQFQGLSAGNGGPHRHHHGARLTTLVNTSITLNLSLWTAR